MLAVTNEFKRQLKKDNRNYVTELRNFTLYNGTVLPTIENNDIWDGGVSFSEATSNASKFEIGAAIIGSGKAVLNNITEKFSGYDFYNATFELYAGLTWIDENNERQTELIKRGFFTVDSAKYNGSLITLECLNNMWRFDKPFSDIANITYPTTARDIINSMCQDSDIGMTLNTQSFPNYDTVISAAPNREMNCREVLQYVAQICGCYCKINVDGDLELSWYDVAKRTELLDLDGGSYNTTTTPYSDGANLNGGTFAYNDGDAFDGGLFTDSYEIAYLSSNSSMEIGTDDIAITGIRVYSNEKDEEYDFSVGSAGYVLEIPENPFINKNNYSAICNQIYQQCNGLVIRTFDASSLSDVSIEAGDICYVCDFRGNRFISYITCIYFTSGNYESFTCGAESPHKKLSVRYSSDVQTLVQAQKNVSKEIGLYDQAVQRMNMLATNMMGCYFATKTDENGGVVCYSSNKPFTYDAQGNLVGCTSGSTVWKRNGVGYFISSSGGTDLEARTYTSGIDGSGNVVVQSLATIGLSADWITAGQVSADRLRTNVIKAINNSNGTADYVTFTFDSQSRTESQNYDYVKIYYRRSNGYYYVSQALGGTIGGSSYYFSLPSDVSYIYVMWHSDNSAHDYYGFKFSEFGSGTRGSYLSFTEQSSPPTSASASYTSWSNIQTAHPYSDNQNLAWYFSAPGLVIDGSKININGNVVFSNLYNGLSSGTTVINGGCIQTGTLSADRIEGGTLKIGGYNDSKGLIEIYDSSNDITGIINNESLVMRSTYSGNYVAFGYGRNTSYLDFGRASSSIYSRSSYGKIEVSSNGRMKIGTGSYGNYVEIENLYCDDAELESPTITGSIYVEDWGHSGTGETGTLYGGDVSRIYVVNGIITGWD